MMTTKERLLLEVQRLSEAQAGAVLEFLESQVLVEKSRPQWPPRFAAAGRSGRSDLAAASEDILRADLGIT